MASFAHTTFCCAPAPSQHKHAVLFGFPPNLSSHLGRSPWSHSYCYDRCGRLPNLLRQPDRKFRILVRKCGLGLPDEARIDVPRASSRRQRFQEATNAGGIPPVRTCEAMRFALRPVVPITAQFLEPL